VDRRGGRAGRGRGRRAGGVAGRSCRGRAPGDRARAVLSLQRHAAGQGQRQAREAGEPQPAGAGMGGGPDRPAGRRGGRGSR